MHNAQHQQKELEICELKPSRLLSHLLSCWVNFLRIGSVFRFIPEGSKTARTANVLVWIDAVKCAYTTEYVNAEHAEVQRHVL